MKYGLREFNGVTLLDHLLSCRGIVEEGDKQDFLNPLYEGGLNDPYLLLNMDSAVDRIFKAIDGNEKIVIFSDYDADGIPGAVVFSDYFKMIGYKNIGVYIPHRHQEGFGLNVQAIESIAKDGAALVITIDCGITDVEEVKRANELGVDVIITDHHEPGPALPAAFAIIDPKISPNYPDKMICGSGTIFKVVEALLKKDRKGVLPGKEKWLLDMVGLATLSDMVPLKGENRILAHFGLKVFRKSPRVGLKKLLSKLKISQKDITEDDIAFMVTPRINVASRMANPIDAFRLLSTENEEEASELVEKLNRLNDERKGAVGAIVKEIQHKISSRGLEDKKVIVLGNPSWSPAVLGLVANSLIKEHKKPVFLWGRTESAQGVSMLKGSCRSEGLTDVVALMHGVVEEVFVDRGGHKMSGGFSLLTKHAHLLEEALNASYEKMYVDAKVVEEHLYADHQLELGAVDFTLWDMIEKMSPFGIDNPKPLFLFRNVTPVEVKKFGKQKEHLELLFNKPNGRKLSAISFFSADEPKFSDLKVGSSFDLVATLEKSMFKSYPELRLRIVDVC